MQISSDNNLDQAVRALKEKPQREGVYREMKLLKHVKPSEKHAPMRRRSIARERPIAGAQDGTRDRHAGWAGLVNADGVAPA